MKTATILLTCLTLNVVLAEQDYFHPTLVRNKRNLPVYSKELDSSFWFEKGQHLLDEHLNRNLYTGRAKNIILFLGDGMSITTITAARILQGQTRNQSGEENSMFFEKFPFTGLSHTYCVDNQVPDSACTATAYLCGVKTNYGTIGVSANVNRGDCSTMADPSNHVYSLGKWAQDAGKATGVVTVTAITDASPSGVYAHTADRNWQKDTDVIKDGGDIQKCPDIAKQLVEGETGRNLNIIMGGGKKNFKAEERTDHVDLIEAWKAQKKALNATYKYVDNRLDLLERDSYPEYLLGLFTDSHFKYNLDDVTKEQPTLAEMTEKAIRNLRTFNNGYFLFVEGGNVDKAHHEARAQKALDEMLQFDEAIQRAVELTDERETLIVVTADHAHTIGLSGYPDRGNNILGLGDDHGEDNLPYSTLSYANGPGYRKEENGSRHDMSTDDMDKDYRYPSAVPKSSETHGGEDVAVFARGPWAHLLSGSYEQNLIPYVMAYAACVGEGRTVCSDYHRRRTTR